MERIEVNFGDEFGFLTVINELPIKVYPGTNGNGNGKYRSFLCRCVCGKLTRPSLGHLRNRVNISCGCKGIKPEDKASKKPEYKVWSVMKQRCNNPKSQSFYQYGGRGIKVCERWEKSFANFIEDMGNRPSADHSIDRIDCDKNYEPSNCRWATRETQMNNRRCNNRIECIGVTKTLTEWSKLLGINASNISHRILNGEIPSDVIEYYIKKLKN